MKVCEVCQKIKEHLAHFKKDANDIARKSLRSGEFVDRKLATSRQEICKTCPHLNTARGVCELCGCYIKAKTILVHATCPDNRWPKDKAAKAQ